VRGATGVTPALQLRAGKPWWPGLRVGEAYITKLCWHRRGLAQAIVQRNQAQHGGTGCASAYTDRKTALTLFVFNMAYLLTVRHGQSVWNLENRFTGETDVDLSPLGEDEARRAGQLLKPYPVDLAYTSVLKRAIRTLAIIEQQTGQTDLPVVRTAALNERNYGALQGLNKAEVAQQYGVAQVTLWRRSYDVAPPRGESLKDTYERVVPYYTTQIEPRLKAGKNVLIVAHGNSLRALMMHLEQLSPVQIARIDLATGVPRLYEFDASLRVLKAVYLPESSGAGPSSEAGLPDAGEV